jgi:hypothetical protein
MDRAKLYRLMAKKWLETAESVEHRALKRCYIERALAYEAMAAGCERKKANGGLRVTGPGVSDLHRKQ